ncbi:hypothetical protein G6F57_019664 [Rhizopus arrhizus]|nr:hypothetical protein G6F57_019664 [Rhizopus arrhizus]
MDAERVGLDGHVAPVDGTHLAFAHHPQHLRHRAVQVFDHGAGARARRQRTIVLVGAVGEHLAGGCKADGTRRVDQLAARQSVQDQRGVHILDRLADGARQALVAGGHVVQRAVRLHMVQPRALRGRHAGQRADLVHHDVIRFVRRDLDDAAAHPRQVLQAGMRA